MRAIVDTNVLIAANQRHTHASLEVAARAAVVLLDVQRGVHILLEDTAGMILDEYKRYCHFSGQPGVADRFFLWFVKSRHVDTAVSRVDVGNGDDLLGHLPSYLHSFDKSDHKWVAVYLVGGGEVVFNALDSDWAEHSHNMLRAGINVRELG
jgi:hypothetical protein